MVTVSYKSPLSTCPQTAVFSFTCAAKTALLLSGFLPVGNLEHTWKNPMTGVIAHLEYSK